MSIIDPKNRNFQSPLKFRLNIERLAHVNFFVTDVNLPGVVVPSPSTPNPLNKINWQPDHMAWDELSVTFIVDEDMKAWQEIFFWIQGQAFPEDHKQYRDMRDGKTRDADGDLLPKPPRPSKPKHLGENFSDGTLLILSSHNNSTLEIDFKDLHPLTLSELNFTSKDTDVKHLTCTVTFVYDYYTVKRP